MPDLKFIKIVSYKNSGREDAMKRIIGTAIVILLLISTVFSISSCSLFSKSVDANLKIEKLD